MKRPAVTLSTDEQTAAQTLLDYVRTEVARLAGGNPGAAFRINRFVHARLQKDGRPTQALQKAKFEEQQGRCAECHQQFSEIAGLPLHRTTPEPYSAENTVLVHPTCHTRIHQRGNAPPD
jgi:hypothetical protein